MFVSVYLVFSCTLFLPKIEGAGLFTHVVVTVAVSVRCGFGWGLCAYELLHLGHCGKEGCVLGLAPARFCSLVLLLFCSSRPGADANAE